MELAQSCTLYSFYTVSTDVAGAHSILQCHSVYRYAQTVPIPISPYWYRVFDARPAPWQLASRDRHPGALFQPFTSSIYISTVMPQL